MGNNYRENLTDISMVIVGIGAVLKPTLQVPQHPPRPAAAVPAEPFAVPLGFGVALPG